MKRVLHVAGSASPTDSDTALLHWAQELITGVVSAHVASGGTLVAQLGDDPRHVADSGLRTLFDWTVLDAAAQAVQDGTALPNAHGRPLVRATCTSTGRRAVSRQNESTLAALRDSGALEITQLPDRRRFGTLLRETQAIQGDVLLTLGGGVGVEHLAHLYSARRQPVIPLDIPIGSFYDDSPQGGEWLAGEAQAEPTRFIEVVGPITASGHIDRLRTHAAQPPLSTMVERVNALLNDLRPRRAFFVRLLDSAAPHFADVEWFFRSVVDPVVVGRGLERVEVGTDQQRESFINTEIFTELHNAPVVVVDMTGSRMNCAIELGYALARGSEVVLTMRHGERPPFDIDKLPFLFWSSHQGADELRTRLDAYWDQQALRKPVVSGRT